MALFLAFCLIVYVAWAALTARPSRRWIKRLRQLERGRIKQEADFIASGCFKDWRNHP
jgi:hypothetical protein